MYTFSKLRKIFIVSFMIFLIQFFFICSNSFSQTLQFNSFSVLPSEAGWDYTTNSSENLFSISDNMLNQNTAGQGSDYGFFQLPRNSTVNSSKPFMVKIRAKVIEVEGNFSGMFFAVVHNNYIYSIKLLEDAVSFFDLSNNNHTNIPNNNSLFNDFILIGGINNQYSFYINNQLVHTGNPVPLSELNYSIHYDLAFGDGTDKANTNANGIWASYQFYQAKEYPEILTIEDIPNDQGGWVNVQFSKSIYDFDLQSDHNIYTIEINDCSGWIAAKTITASAKDYYNVTVPTTKNRTIEIDGNIQFRIIAGMTGGNYQSNIVTGYSIDNLSPVKPSNLTAALTSNLDVKLNWNLNSEEDLSHYNVYISDSLNNKIHLAVITDNTYTHTEAKPNQTSEYFVSAVDLSGNESEYAQVDIFVSNPAPSITEVVDVPEDQGYWVKVNFTKSYFDNDTLTNPNKGTVKYYEVEKDEGFGWDSAGYTVAYGKDEYSVLVQTNKNSSVKNDSLCSFRVTAFFGENTYISDVMTGCSVDNIPPMQPQNIVASVIQDSLILLSWKGNTEDDFSHYVIRKSYDGINFVNAITTSDSIFIDANIKLTQNYIYTIEAFDFAGNSSGYSEKINVILTDIETANNIIPSKFELKQNYPNPFNPTTTISYSIPKTSFVRLKIYNVGGEEIAELINQYQTAGKYNIDFNAAQLSSGIYLYRIEAGIFNAIKKMILIK